jgi:hypothetical protein
MDAASSKPRSRSRSRKSMRVATLFTGVAACTLGTATQVAHAQDAAPTVPAGKSYGSIRYSQNCGNQGIDKTWLHVSTNNSSPYASQIPYTSFCFGYKGLWGSPPGIGINYECGGNNHGLLVGVTAAGRKWSTGFGPGTTYRTLHEAHLDGVFINSWTGDDKCPKPPNWFD